METDHNKDKILLKWDAVEKQIKEGKTAADEKKLASPASVFAAFNNKADLKFIDTNEVAKEINKRWLERIARDAYIEESFMIMLDLIRINNTN